MNPSKMNMETIKALLSLVAVSVVILVIVGMADLKSQRNYAAKLNATTVTNVAETEKPATAETVKNTKAGVTKTNAVAEQKNNNPDL